MDNILLLIQAPVLSVEIVLNGIAIGAIFALAAYGMALVWGVMNIINVNQGELVMLGGYVTFTLTKYGVHPLFGIPVAAIVLFLLGWIIYRGVIFRVVERDLFISLLATFGLSILLQQLMNQVFGADVEAANAGFGTRFMFDDMVTISDIRILSFVLAFVIAGCLVVFFRYSRLGQAIRATAQDARAARIMGIDTGRVYAATYALNAAICGAAGALVVMVLTIHPYAGLPYTIRSFMIVVVAGVGNLPGVIVAGLGLGAAEKYAGFILGAEYQLAFVFLLLVAVLVFRNYRLSRKRQYLK